MRTIENISTSIICFYAGDVTYNVEPGVSLSLMDDDYTEILPFLTDLSNQGLISIGTHTDDYASASEAASIGIRAESLARL